MKIPIVDLNTLSRSLIVKKDIYMAEAGMSQGYLFGFLDLKDV